MAVLGEMDCSARGSREEMIVEFSFEHGCTYACVKLYLYIKESTFASLGQRLATVHQKRISIYFSTRNVHDSSLCSIYWVLVWIYSTPSAEVSVSWYVHVVEVVILMVLDVSPDACYCHEER